MKIYNFVYNNLIYLLNIKLCKIFLKKYK
jgi:hypothetical protein